MREVKRTKAGSNKGQRGRRPIVVKDLGNATRTVRARAGDVTGKPPDLAE